MPFFSRKKPPTQQPGPVCTWSAHAPQSGSSRSPFPRDSHTLTATATATGEFFLFGGFKNNRTSSDLYVFSTRDFTASRLQTSGEVPTPCQAHGAVLIGTTLLIYGGTNTDSFDLNALNSDSLCLLNLESREWTRVVVNGPGPNSRVCHTTNVVGSKLFVFGGWNGTNVLNDIWALDLSCLKSQPHWESYEPTPGNEKPLPRRSHVSVTTEDRIIVFGGYNGQHTYNDTWSFNISTREWTELQCTGSIPSPRCGHAAVLVDDVMYVFGGFTGKTDLDDLYALQLSTQRWFKFYNVGPSPHRRSSHTMASDGTRIFVLGGYSRGAPSEEISLIHVFDMKDIKYPEPECNAVNPNETTAQLAGKSFTGPATLKQPQHPISSSEGEVSKLELVSQPCDALVPLSLRSKQYRQLLFKLAQKSTLLEVAEANAAEATKRAGLHADRLLMQTSLVEESDAELVDIQARLDELQLSRDQQEIALQDLRSQFSDSQTTVLRLETESKRHKNEAERLKDGMEELKASHETAIAQAQKQTGSLQRDKSDLQQSLGTLKAEMARLNRQLPRMGSSTTPEVRERSDLLTPNDREMDDVFGLAPSTSRRHGDTSATFSADGDSNFDSCADVPPSRPFQPPNHPSNKIESLEQYEKELTNARAKLEAKESELEAVRSRLTDAENGLTKSKAGADTLRAQTATGSVNGDEDQVTLRLLERVRAIEAEMVSKRWNEKRIEEMECRNEG